GQVFDGNPVELDVLADGDIGRAAGVSSGQIRDGSELARSQEPIRQANAQHKVGHGFALTALATGYAGSIALSVNTPPAEIRSDPGCGHGREPLAGELADLVEALPRVLFPLEPLRLLRLGFLYDFCRCTHDFDPRSFLSQKSERPIASLAMGPS